MNFDPLMPLSYDVIVADPPWRFSLYSENGEKKSAAKHYDTMETTDITRLPVGHLARDNCLLLLWACGCMLPQAIEAMTSWGFVFKSEIIWRKVTVNGKPRWGTGYRVRTMHEPILVGTIGHPNHGAFPSIVDGVAREHSRKPDEVYELVRKYTPGARRADLFSRETREGFEGWGAEHGKFDQEAA
jgi:N6-adenosine-specific RNA methylase IME4